MRKLYVFLLIVSIASAGVISYKSSKNFKRKWYETVLKGDMKGRMLAGSSMKGKKAADQPDMAALQDFYMTADPSTGKVPRERLFRVYEQMEDAQHLKSTASQIQWTSYPVEMGGRTRAMMFDPNEPDKVWAGGVTGGLWYNSDITNPWNSWVAVNDFWSCLSIRCITFDPNNHNTFYLGTGEPETALQTYRESSGLGNGIWKSTDGGQTWNPLASTSGFAYTTKIIVRNENGASVIYAGVVSGLYHGIHTSQPSEGLFRSTDGGNTWTQVLPVIEGTPTPYSPADIVLGADNRIYVGSMPNLEGKGGATILWSDSGLPGSWNVNISYRNQILTDPDYSLPGRVILATAPSDANRVYALISQGYINPSNNFKYFYCFKILKSTDKGVSWTNTNLPNDLTSGISFVTIGWHAMDAVVDPNNPDVFWVGGLDVHRSSNAGQNWNRVSDWAAMYSGGGPEYVHADQHLMLYKPGSSSEMILATDGGVFYTSLAHMDNPAFEERNLDYNTLQFYTADIKNDPSEVVLMGGLQDNGTEFCSPGTPLSINTMISGGDGAYCFFDKADPDFYMSSIYYNTWYLFVNGGFYNYLDSWSCGTFVNPADYDDANKTLYSNACDFIGTNLDYYCRIKNILTGPSGGFVKLNTDVTTWFSAIRLSPYSPAGTANLFIGTQSGRLFKVTRADATPVTTEITGSQFPVGNISSIDVGAGENELLVTFSNYGVSSVWHTTDGGTTWKNKENNLPDMPVRWGIFHPVNKKQVMLATEAGIWTTHLFDQEQPFWVQSVSGMANVRVDMLNLRESDNTVVAASHGRGLFTTTWDDMTGVEGPSASCFSVYPNPVRDHVNVQFEGKAGEPVLFRIYDQSGRTLITRESKAVPGRMTESLTTASLPSGVYYLAVYINGKLSGTQKIIRIK